MQKFTEEKLSPDFCKEKILEIKELILSSTSFTVVGLPAMGISIFLKYLTTTKIAHFIHVDINDLPKFTQTELFKLLALELGEKIFSSYSDQEVVELSKVKLLKLISKYPRVVIIFNRFDSLKGEFSKTFFANIRSLRDVDKEKIIMIFAANKPLIEQAPEALVGGNLHLFSKNYYLKPYSEKDLKRLVKLNSPKLKISQVDFEKALKLSGGHYQTLQLLMRSEYLKSNPLWDFAIRLQMKELYEYLDYQRRKILQKIALGKRVSIIDPYLLNIGYLKSDSTGCYQIFTPLLSDFIKDSIHLRLPIQENKLFQFLKNRLGQVISKDEIFNHLWSDADSEATDWALNSLVYRLRKNPTFALSGYIIESHKKLGYSLIKV